MAYSLLEELKNKRTDMVKTLKSNNAYDGFKKVLSEMYPENAHFIYELLQNAEDVHATNVKFALKEDELVFEHNGHDFTLENIDSITSVGNSLKSGNDLAIGKFGVGFKAVYTYTDTPEIHSGKFDFKIREMFIPDDDGVSKIAQEHFTRFVFPFDSKTKPKQVAVQEITEGLLSLDETSLLFLNNIKSISFELCDGSNYHIKALSDISDIKFIIEIEKGSPNNATSHTYWSKFSDKCPLYIEDKVKFYDVSIAYKMDLDFNTQKFSLNSTLNGKVCISFPTDQTSLLHFHINAPFASTVARDNIKYCEENEKLIDALAKLTAESLYFLRDKQLLDYSAYATLPTLRDFNNQLNSRYRIFATRIKEEFESAELFITDNGKYCAINDIFNAANKDIKTILPIEYVEKLYQRSWIPTVSSVTRIEYFIDQFEIDEYSIEDFIDSLEKDNTFFDELLSQQKDIEYFKTLYYQLSQSSRERNRYSIWDSKPSRNEILNKVEFILCEDKVLHSIKDSIFLRTDYQPKHYLKNPLYADLSLKNNAQDREIKQFLLSFGIKEMCEREDLIADVSGDNISVDDMILKIMEIIEGYKSDSINIEDFEDSSIFIATNGDENNYRVKACECCWNSVSSFFYQKTKYTLIQEHYQVIGEDLPILKEIFSKLGGKITPTIVESKDLSEYSFPLHNLLKTTGERYDTCLKSTYTIDEFDWDNLKHIQTNNLTDEAFSLWQLVLSCNNNDWLYTRYSPNWKAPVQKLESTLVYYLKRIAWVPTATGTYKCPYELTPEDLLDEYKYEQPSLLLTEISKKPNDAVEQLKNKDIQDENILAFAGLDSDVQERILAIAGQMQEQKRKTGKSLSELAATSDRSQSPEEDDDDDYGAFHKPKNTDKRKLKLEKEFDDREDLPTFIKKLQFVLEKPNTEEKAFVRNEYHAHCQLCGNEGILTAKGKRYFEAINIFNTGKLDDSLQIKLDLGWNTLCLCPNCAAKFKYSQLTISGLIKQVESIDVSAAQSAFIDISITLEGKPKTIRFTPNHLLALQVAIKKIKEIEENS